MTTTATLLDDQLIELAEELGGVCKTIQNNVDSVKTTAEQALVEASKPGLPDQTGHDGKVLTTDGTNASWQAVDAGTSLVRWSE